MNGSCGRDTRSWASTTSRTGRWRTSHRASVIRDFRFEVLDCARRRRELRVALDGCDAIAHLAAKKIPRYGGAVSTLEVNVSGVHSACAVALSLGADLIVTSTSDVYGNATPPFAEDDHARSRPVRRPGAGRMPSRSSTTSTSRSRSPRSAACSVTILRLFNVYGPRNHLSWWGGPMVTFTEALLDGEPMEIHGDGQQTRTFTYVSDTVDGFVRALQTPEARGEVINIGATETISILEFAGARPDDARDPDAPSRHVRRRTTSSQAVPGRPAPCPRHDESAALSLASRPRSASTKASHGRSTGTSAAAHRCRRGPCACRRRGANRDRDHRGRRRTTAAARRRRLRPGPDADPRRRRPHVRSWSLRVHLRDVGADRPAAGGICAGVVPRVVAIAAVPSGSPSSPRTTSTTTTTCGSRSPASTSSGISSTRCWRARSPS